ncbi:TerB family tellurite resistance protein [Candidatus Pelagibacter sp.]|nr:TerB family tellurite resistance protein [Candidatus Pelagibacter sp.]|tara:strand:+ start:180 stop:605 length:426 start_codon:yes stop_codon:yes gene_type:complete
MFNIFKKEETEKENNHPSIMAVTCLLIHSARIDQNYSENEKKIIKDALVKMGSGTDEIDKIMLDAEEKEKDSNQILDFTREVKNINEEDKKIIIEALWDIIYSDKNADMYETNLMRRLSGLLYLDPKIVGDIKEKVRQKKT